VLGVEAVILILLLRHLEALAAVVLAIVSRTFDLALLRAMPTQLASVVMAVRPLHPTCLAVQVVLV
jgi:hypothetical protein